jgi:serine/threonine protein kinase
LTTAADPTSWQRAKDIISQALRRTPADREPFVRERCSDAPALCADILALLEQYDSDAPAREQAVHHDTLDDLQPGATIGGYVVVDRLGRGGMGQVFRGRDRDLHREVALKCLISSGSARRNDRALILNEARAAAAISHPNVATVHHVVEHGDRAFIVMEYVAGDSLSTVLRRGRLPVDRVVDIARQLTAALKAAHAQGVIHRDLKPGNIHVTPDGLVKVIDFGIARAARTLTTTAAPGAMAPGAGPVTQVVYGGTPPYMSPEQLLGQPVDERSDIYSLGLVVFEMATGRRAYLETGPLALIDALTKGAPRADDVDPRVPRAIADVIATALAVQPAARFQSATDFDAALEAAQRTLRPAPAPMHRILTRLGWAASSVAAVLASLYVLGFLTTLIFNKSVGRKGGFQTETWSEILTWGAKSLVGPAVLVIMGSGIVWGVLTLARLAATWKPIDRWLAAIRETRAVAGISALLHDSTRLEQLVSVAGTLAILVLLALYSNMIDLLTYEIDTAPRASLELLASVSPSVFRLRASWLVVALGFSLVWIARLRLRRRGSRHSSLYACIAVFAVAVIVNDLPYRLVRDRLQERVAYNGARCYMAGERADAYLLFCPELSAPRSRIVSRTDAGLTRTGIRESMFEPLAR